MGERQGIAQKGVWIGSLELQWTLLPLCCQHFHHTMVRPLSNGTCSNLRLSVLPLPTTSCGPFQDWLGGRWGGMCSVDPTWGQLSGAGELPGWSAADQGSGMSGAGVSGPERKLCTNNGALPQALSLGSEHVASTRRIPQTSLQGEWGSPLTASGGAALGRVWPRSEWLHSSSLQHDEGPFGVPHCAWGQGPGPHTRNGSDWKGFWTCVLLKPEKRSSQHPFVWYFGAGLVESKGFPGFLGLFSCWVSSILRAHNPDMWITFTHILQHLSPQGCKWKAAKVAGAPTPSPDPHGSGLDCPRSTAEPSPKPRGCTNERHIGDIVLREHTSPLSCSSFLPLFISLCWWDFPGEPTGWNASHPGWRPSPWICTGEVRPWSRPGRSQALVGRFAWPAFPCWQPWKQWPSRACWCVYPRGGRPSSRAGNLPGWPPRVASGKCCPCGLPRVVRPQWCHHAPRPSLVV